MSWWRGIESAPLKETMPQGNRRILNQQKIDIRLSKHKRYELTSGACETWVCLYECHARTASKQKSVVPVTVSPKG